MFVLPFWKMEHFSKYFNLLLRMRWRGRREDGRDEEAALKNEVNGRNQINTMITGVSVRLLSNSRLNRKVSWLPPRLQRKLRVPSIQGVRVLSLILSEPHAVLVTSHLDIIIINLLPDYGSLVHGWNHIQNPTIEKNDKVISDHKVSNVCKECTFYTKDCNTDRCLSVCACEAASVSDCLRPHGLQPTRSSVHGILQARILEWVAIPSSRGSSQLRNQPHVSCVSCIGRQVLYH